VLRAYSNELDATEQGVYAVSFTAVEALAGLVAVRRAEMLTGADYYVAPLGTDPEDMESYLRMEVSGVGAGNETIIRARLRQKLRQTENGRSCLVSCDHVPRRSWPLFRARAMLGDLIAGFGNLGIQSHQEQLAA